MDNHQDETTTFEVTVTSDGVSTSGISSPQIVLDNSNTLSWGINECSSSFQSVSSCETLESYDPNQIVTAESPQVIVVPFLADDHTSDTVLAGNGVQIPVIKECSIRIDQTTMESSQSEEMEVEKIIELPFSTHCTAESSTKTESVYLSDDDSAIFEGFDVESIVNTDYDLYKKAVLDITKRNAERAENSRDPILTERILIDRHLSERQPPSIKVETVKRPRQVQRKTSKPQHSDNQTESSNQSRVESTEANRSTGKPNNIAKPIIPMPDRVTSTPVQNVDVKSKLDISSDTSDSDSDVIAAPVDSSASKKNVDRSADIKNNNNKQKELRKQEKMRRKKELSLVAERIRDHWREMFAAARRKQRKKERRNKSENHKHKSYYTKNGGSSRHDRKRKRISCSSDSDSTDSSTSSRTSGSSSSSDSSDDTTNASDTSYTSQTSHTRTEESSTDSDSSDMYHRYKHRLNRCRRRSPSATSDTTETSSSDDDDDDDDTLDKRRKFNLLKRAIYRKKSKSRSDENCTRQPRKRKSSQSSHHRSDDESVLRKKWKMTKNSDREQDNDVRRVKNRTIFSQKQQSVHNPPRSASPANKKKFKPNPRSAVESTSAGAFSVEY